MLVKVNTNTIREMAEISVSASQLVVEAAGIPDALASHDDWYCKEKLSIDAKVNAIKKSSRSMKEGFEDFASYMSRVAGDYERMVQDEERDLAMLDKDFAGILSIVGSGPVVVGSGAHTSTTCESLCKSASNVSVMNSLSVATSPISIMNYPT